MGISSKTIYTSLPAMARISKLQHTFITKHSTTKKSSLVHIYWPFAINGRIPVNVFFCRFYQRFRLCHSQQNYCLNFIIGHCRSSNFVSSGHFFLTAITVLSLITDSHTSLPSLAAFHIGQ